MKMTQMKNVLVGTVVVLALLFCVQGCKKDEPAAEQSAGQMQDHDHSMHAEMSEAANDMAKTAEETVAAGEQTVCPVMAGNPIDKSIFTEYKGKKVYFCCQGCIAAFKADPEKYIAKLPQFQEK